MANGIADFMQNMKNQKSGNVPQHGSIASTMMNMNSQAQAGMQPSLQPQQINPLASAMIRMNNQAQGGTMQSPRPQYQNLMPFLSGGALGGFGGGSPMSPSYGFSSAMNQSPMQQQQSPMPLMVGGNNGPLSAPQQQQFNNFQNYQQQNPQSAIQFPSRSGSR